MKVVYVSGKFRGPNSWAMEQNIRAAEELSLEVWKLGAVALCPHLNTRFFQGAAPDELWLDGDIELVRRCDAMLMVSNWQDSVGARHEKEFADSIKQPVFFKIEVLQEWLKHQATLDSIANGASKVE